MDDRLIRGEKKATVRDRVVLQQLEEEEERILPW